jgi:hypothetical protein
LTLLHRLNDPALLKVQQVGEDRRPGCGLEARVEARVGGGNDLLHRAVALV